MAKTARTAPQKYPAAARQIKAAQDFPPSMPIDIIDVDPIALQDPDSSFLNAIVAHMQQKNIDGAIALATTRAGAHPKNPTLINLIAALNLQKRDTQSAEKYLIQAARFAPQDLKIANNLACVHILRGSYRTAETILRAQLRNNTPSFAEYYHNIGLALFYQERFAEARVELERALQLEHLIDTYALIAYAELLAENYKVAEHTLITGLKHNPHSHLLRYHLGFIYMFMEKWQEAITFAMLALRADPGNRYYAASYSMIARHFQFLIYIPEHADAVEKVLNNPGVNPSNMNQSWLSLFSTHPEWESLLRKGLDMTAADVATQIDTMKAKGRINDSFIMTGLRRTILRGPHLEWLFTHFRSIYLQRAASNIHQLDNADYDVLSALACQSFLNEYAYFVSPEDQSALQTLHQCARTLTPDDAAFIPTILALSMYENIGNLMNDTQAMALREHPLFTQIITDQIINRVTELHLMSTIPQLTPIHDNVSRAVEQMYMENPYPAWTATNYGGDPFFLHLDPDPAKRIQVLVAGCGTGIHPTMVALNGENLQVLAIDLSRRSIAYGLRKVQEMGLTNIDFAQADILELGQINRKFDYIESAGVLHHLRDPEKGLRVLLGLLKSHGCLRLGLYSEVARKAMVAGRDYVAAKNLGSTPDAIRNFRRYVFDRPKGDPLKKLLEIGDFYSISTCRDLVFHIQETRYTMQSLKKLLDDNDLEFHGFFLEIPKMSEFKKRHPNQMDLKNMDLWEQFEYDFPDTFSNMYQFLVQKRK